MKNDHLRQIIREEIDNLLSDNSLNLNKQFHAWFDGSKVIDKDGNPLVVYHGTNAKFRKFNFKKLTMPVIWFTTDKSSITSGESGAQGIKHIMELYVSIKNPAGWDEYEKYGLGQLTGFRYDGVILSREGDHFDGFVFEPNQLKSVNNDGSWDIGDKNIFS